MKKTQTDLKKLKMKEKNRIFASHWPEIRQIMEAVDVAGGEARLVGGCVRDALMGRSLGDIDLACDLKPNQMERAFTKFSLHTVPTGIDFGTLTVVINKRGFEITSLRSDIDPDGRHTKVKYTRDWAKDAARRDFTINALYMNQDGEITDYVGGLEDIEKRRLRFIGKAEERIREDVLRLLRYFRFAAQLEISLDTLVEDDLEACAKMASKIESLSAERVQKELMLLLAAKNPVPVLKMMEERGILENIFLPPYTWVRFEELISEGPECEPLLRLGALLKAGHKKVANGLKFSNKNKDRLTFMENIPEDFYRVLDEKDVRQLLYDYGSQKVEDAFSLINAEIGKDFSIYKSLCENWNKPTLPIKGEDLINRGYEEGPELGEAMEAVTRFWRSKDFTPDRARCLKYLEALNKKS